MPRLAICAAGTVLLLFAAVVTAAEPTFLKRSISATASQPDDLTKGVDGVSYRPLYGGKDDPHGHLLKSVARYGELTVSPGGKSAAVVRPGEEQIFFVLAGTGTVLCDEDSTPVKANDFLYIPPGSRHRVNNSSGEALRLLVMGFRIPKNTPSPPSPVPHATRMMIANTADVPDTILPSHGPTVQFKLLMGTTESTRDKLPAASQMVSLFLMDFAPGGTNIPHHHPLEEEVYFILKGSGEMVAGGGLDGNEGRHATREGDAWFLRLNATVGFYSGAKPGGEHDQVLAVRSSYPFPPSRKP